MFIQTDKSTYKPADKVNFRVLILDEETRPFEASNVHIYITDGGDNRLKQFDNVKFVKGVHQNELQLSDSPVLGKWKIHVKVNNQKDVEKQFEVAEYVLPKFELTIDTNPDLTYANEKVIATVKAKYTFGKIAKGNATVTAKGTRTVTKMIEINGKKNVEFDMKKELGIEKSWTESTVNLFATFTEELSGKEQNATAKVQVHTTPHKIEFKKGGEKFKPGLPFKITAIVKFQDKNAPVTDKVNPVKFKTKFFHFVEKKCNYPHFGWNQWNSRENSENEYDCGREESYEVVKEIFSVRGRAELTIDVPSIAKRLNVEVC